MTTIQARQTVKAINRRFRRQFNAFTGGQCFGVDFATWNVVYPQTASIYLQCAKTLAGRSGRFMPPVFR